MINWYARQTISGIPIMTNTTVATRLIDTVGLLIANIGTITLIDINTILNFSFATVGYNRETVFTLTLKSEDRIVSSDLN